MLAGIVTFDGSDFSEELISKLVGARQNAELVARNSPGAVFVQPRARKQAGFDGGRDGDLFAASARLDNREELGAALGIAPAELARTSDSVLLLRMFKRWGDAGLGRCLGAFAFALWDSQARRLMLGRDCIGKRALFFHRGKDFAAFASTPGSLLTLPGVPREIDEIALANLLAANMRERTRTYYRAIARVPSRTLVTIERGAIHHRYYWSPNLDLHPPYRKEEDYIERARELLDQSVADATRDLPKVAISTSGGLDSSTVAATVARLGRAASITCYTLVPPRDLCVNVGPDRYIDERDKVDALARLHSSLEIKFVATDHLHRFDEDATRYFARTNVPAFGPTNLGIFSLLYDAVLADDHCVLLNGAGGNLSLTWLGRFSLLELARAQNWSGVMHEVRALARRTGDNSLRIALTEALPALPETMRRLFFRFRGRDPDSVARYSVLNPDFIFQHDLTKRWRSQGFDPWGITKVSSIVRHRAYFMFDHNQFARDTEAMHREHRGIELRDPLTDRRLLEFSLTVPEAMHRRNGVPRSFARAVLADRLPREILDERRRGVQAPDWFRRLSARKRDIELEIERLENSSLARRMLDLPRLKNLLAQWPQDEQSAETRRPEYRSALTRGIHVGRFIRWVEGGNA